MTWFWRTGNVNGGLWWGGREASLPYNAVGDGDFQGLSRMLGEVMADFWAQNLFLLRRQWELAEGRRKIINNKIDEKEEEKGHTV